MAAPGLLTKLFSEPWAIHQDHIPVLLREAEQRLASPYFSSETAQCDLQGPDIERLGPIGVIRVCGPILKFPDVLDLQMGACDIDRVRTLTQIALLDPTLEQVVYRIDSPGGSSLGIPECAAEIAELADSKPVWAFTESAMASAAYWLGSQAHGVFCTPSSMVGSVGVYSIFQDQSEMLAAAGIKINAIASGDWKLAGMPFKPMSKEERAYFQDSVEYTAGKFRAAVSSGRPQISAELMQGQMFKAEPAVANGFVDGIVNELEDLLALISG